jgi:hypothetical protein
LRVTRVEFTPIKKSTSYDEVPESSVSKGEGKEEKQKRMPSPKACIAQIFSGPMVIRPVAPVMVQFNPG